MNKWGVMYMAKWLQTNYTEKKKGSYAFLNVRCLLKSTKILITHANVYMNNFKLYTSICSVLMLCCLIYNMLFHCSLIKDKNITNLSCTVRIIKSVASTTNIAWIAASHTTGIWDINKSSRQTISDFNKLMKHFMI